ncbi:M14 family zinc carboxypeptidase [Candidatus Zixiibacteriota bacterium]
MKSIQTSGVILRRMALTGAIVSLVILTGGAALAQNLPRTGAEAAEWNRHTTHEELVEYLFEVQSMSDNMLVQQLTTTAEGRGVYLVMLGDPPTATPGTAWFSGKPTVFIVQNVHGGELSGREGGLLLIRDLALGSLKPLLKDVNVLIIPSINPDGSNRQPRPTRGNSLGYDMNRDYVVMETREITTVVEDVLTQWWPDVHVDTHNGGARPYNLTWQTTLHPAADRDMINLANGPMFEYVRDHMEAEGLQFFFYSGARQDPETGEWMWTTTEPLLRKQHSYSGFQNMIALLFECPGGELELQARSQKEGQVGLLRYVAENAGLIRSTVMEARRRTLAREQSDVVLSVERSEYPQDYQFYVREGGAARQPGMQREAGAERPAGQQSEPQYTLVTGKLGTLYIPLATRSRPWAYAFDGNLYKIAELLRRHAIEVEKLVTPVTTTVERYRVASAEYATSTYQNHLLATVGVELYTEEITLPAGTYLVRTGQNGGTLAAYLLEPDTDDSLVTWNFLDHLRLSPGRTQGEREIPGSELPIYRIMSQVGVRAVLFP